MTPNGLDAPTTAPRLEIDLAKIHHNARRLVESLSDRGISVTGVTKGALGSPEIARTLLRAGVVGLGDSRIENIETLRKADVATPMALIRSPMVSQVDRIVEHADVSFNTEIDVITKLSAAALGAGQTHAVLLMVELGDLREGVMPRDLHQLVRETLSLANITLAGIGTNLACQSGVAPDAEKMGELSALATSIETQFDVPLAIVSGGNSANLEWALSGADIGRVNNLRLGESILLGRETLHRLPIPGMHTDAITLVAEVIESKVKPSQPWGEIAQTAFGGRTRAADVGERSRTILAVGHQDVDPYGLHPPIGTEILGASSDHLVTSGPGRCAVGSEIRFEPNYGALIRAMASPFVTKVMTNSSDHDDESHQCRNDNGGLSNGGTTNRSNE